MAAAGANGVEDEERLVIGSHPSSSSTFLRPFGVDDRRTGENALSSGDSLLASSPAAGSWPVPRESWLLRLFKSKLFDMSIAIGYLFNSKEPGVQEYLGNRLFVIIIIGSPSPPELSSL